MPIFVCVYLHTLDERRNRRGEREEPWVGQVGLEGHNVEELCVLWNICKCK